MAGKRLGEDDTTLLAADSNVILPESLHFDSYTGNCGLVKLDL